MLEHGLLWFTLTLLSIVLLPIPCYTLLYPDYPVCKMQPNPLMKIAPLQFQTSVCPKSSKWMCRIAGVLVSWKIGQKRKENRQKIDTKKCKCTS